jgi:hypothetical protein
MRWRFSFHAIQHRVVIVKFTRLLHEFFAQL